MDSFGCELRRKVRWRAFLFFLILTIAIPVSVSAATLYVPDDYSTIQGAVDAASSGDTIIVKDGTYNENVVVSKDNLTIKSENGADFTTVKAQTWDDHVFTVRADHVTVKGLSFTGANHTENGSYYPVAGLRLQDADDCSITNNHTYDNNIGLSLDHSNNNAVVGNSSSNIHSGVYLGYSNNNVVKSNNSKSNPGYGIKLWHSSGNDVKRNVVKSNDYGLWLYHSDDNQVYKNKLGENTDGIVVQDALQNNIYSNNIVDNGINVNSSNSDNTWHSPEKTTYAYATKTYTNYLGNYWSDYSGSDSDGDGIGDSSYSINSESDDYPLMKFYNNYTETEEQPVNFPDENLEQAIRDAIGKQTGDIYPSDMKGLEELYAGTKGIENLTGIEYCEDLRTLDLIKNSISDISPLSKLTNLQKLRLWDNNISNISPLSELFNLQWLGLGENYISSSDLEDLSNLTKLQELVLFANNITDVSPLANLINLQGLYLDSNNITDVSPLANLTKLKKLDLDRTNISEISSISKLTNLQGLYLKDNNISDVQPLVDNSGLDSEDYIDIRGNYLDLSEDSEDMENIQTLIDRGAVVEYEPQDIIPHRPTNISPKDGSANISRMPTLKSSEFAHPDPELDHIATKLRIVTESRNYDDPVFAIEIPSPLTSIPIMHGVLEHETTYYWQVKYKDDQGNWSEWSQETSFTTLAEPHAEFEMDDDRSGAVLLDASASESSRPDGNIIGYLWDTNGDGTIDAVRETEKLYGDWMSEGSYDVTLKVVDDKGGISRVTKSINVTRSGYDTLLEILAEWLGLTDKVQGQAIAANPRMLIGIKEWFSSSWRNLSNIDEWLRNGDGNKYEWVEDVDPEFNPEDVLTVLKKDINPTVMEKIYGEKSNFDEAENYTYMKHILGVIEEAKFVHGAFKKEDTWVSASAFRVAMPVVKSLLKLHPMVTPLGVGEISSLIFGPNVELVVNLFEMAIALHDLLGPAMEEMQNKAFGEAFTLYLRPERRFLARNQIKLAFDLHDEEKLDEVYGEVTNHFDDLIELYGDKAERGEGLTDDFREKIRESVKNLIAELLERHKDELIDKKWLKIWSPVEIRVYDTSDNVTGVVQGEVKEEIDNSIFFPQDEELVIYEPVEGYRAELIGTEEGDYNLSSSSRVDGETVSFTGSNISIEKDSDHQYTADWQKLSEGKDGVTVTIDSNGDGEPENEMRVGNAFSGMEKGTNVEREFTNQGITLLFDEVTSRGFTDVNVFKKPNFNTTSGIHLVGDSYKFDTTASFNGEVEVTLNYDDSRLTSTQEESLKLYKITQSGEAQDITTSLDTTNNTVTGTTQSFSYFAVGYPEIRSLPTGWDLFSPPGIPLDPDPTAALGDDLDNPTLYYDYSEGQGYKVYPTDNPDTALTWKKGYWLYLNKGKDIDIDVSSPAENLTIQFTDTGWKQIGVPYNFDWSQLSFSDPQDFETDGAGHVRLVSWNPSTETYLNHYSNNSYVLDPWRGYWIKVNQASSSNPATITVTETNQSATATGTHTPLPQSVDRENLDYPPLPHHVPKEGIEAFAYPNPVKAEDRVVFSTGSKRVETIKVAILTPTGRTIYNSDYQPGNKVTWNLKDTTGARVPNGLYLYQVVALDETGEEQKSKVHKLLVLR